VKKISMLTAYDFTMAKIVDTAGVDVILVGDSASNVMAGHETTLPITLDQMIYHASSVVRAIDRAGRGRFAFGSYQSDSKEALRSSIRIMKESGGHAVKLEGGSEIKNRSKDIECRNSGDGAFGFNAAVDLQIRHIHRAPRRRRSQPVA
jgi:3-methyl-2-oxobutanoate hydroxymethyltransferase